jgi:hypothetical protein
MNAIPAESARTRAAEASLDALAANADARSQLRRQVDRREFRLAIRDLAQGLRGVIRAAPVSAVLVGIAFGACLSARMRRRA